MLPTTPNRSASDVPNEVFISYRRAEPNKPEAAVFVEDLKNALEQRSITIWFDLEDIPFATEWRDEIKGGIDVANVFMPIIRPSYLLVSGPCNMELAYALQQGKKIIPIWYEALSPQDEAKLATCTWEAWEGIKKENGKVSAYENYQALRDLNYISIKEKTLSKEIVDAIYETILTDYDYVKASTNYHLRSLEWVRKNKKSELALRGIGLEEAERWLDKQVKGATPSELQREFIRFSRQTQNMALRRDRNRLRSLATAISIGLIVAVILALLANDQRIVANNREQARATQQSIAETESEARNNQLQTLVLLDNSLSKPVGHNPSVPLLVDWDVWVSNRADNTLMRFAMGDATLLATFEVGDEPLSPVAAGGYIWTASIRDKTISRIAPQDNSVLTLPAMDDTPQNLLVTGQFLWVIARHLAVQVNMQQGVVTKTIPLDGEVFSSYYADPYIWLIRNTGLIRLDAVTGVTQSILFGTDLQSPRMAGNSLWVTDSSQAQIWQLDPDTLAILSSQALGAGLGIPKIVDGELWVASAPQPTGDALDYPQKVFHLDSRNGEIHFQWNLSDDLHGAMIADYHVVGGRLWVISSDSRLLSYPLDSQELLTEETLPQESSLTEPVWDGRNLWFSNQRVRQILVIHGETGKIIRRLTNCDHPSQVAFDGANMWASCRNNQPPSLLRIPAYVYYHGLGTQREVVDTGSSILPQVPLYDGKRLWVVQESDGVLVVFDLEQECVVGVIAVGGNPSPPFLDIARGRYWISRDVITGQTVQHFIDSYDIKSHRLEECSRDPINPQNTTQIHDEPGTLTAIGDRLWVNITLVPDTNNGPDNLILFDLEQGNRVSSWRYNQYVNAIAPNDPQSVWLAAPDMTTNDIYLVDGETGEERRHFPIAHFPWEPVILEEDVWVSTAFQGGMFNAGPNLFESRAARGALYRFDRQTGNQEFMQEFEGFISPIHYMGNYLWMLRSTEMPPVGDYFVRSANTLIAFDPLTETVAHEFSPCENILPPLYDPSTHWAWVPCLGLEYDAGNLWVIDTTDGHIVRQFENLGLDAQPPVQIGNTIWVVYRESQYVAIFDAQTAQLRTILGVGASPSPPVVDSQGDAWVANVGSATIQRIVLLENLP